MNTVDGIPEKDFRAGWMAALWRSMWTRQKGYAKSQTAGHTGKSWVDKDGTKWSDRRPDKHGTTKLSRRIAGSEKGIGIR